MHLSYQDIEKCVYWRIKLL